MSKIEKNYEIYFSQKKRDLLDQIIFTRSRSQIYNKEKKGLFYKKVLIYL